MSIVKIKALRLTAVVITVFVVVILFSNIAHAEKSFKYAFEVDGEGGTNVTVFFYDGEDGVSWLLVPKDQKELLDLMVYEGELLNVTYRSLMNGDREDPFYVIMEFSYKASRAVNLTIRYSMKYGALVIEPNAVFISPRIMHEGSQTEVITYLPSYAQTSESKVSAISSYIENVSVTRSDKHVMISTTIGSNGRLVVEYTLPKESVLTNITSGKFTFKVHSRYLDFAYDILNALNETYMIYREIFGSEPNDIFVEFFVPSKRDLVLGIEGYVPIVGEELGPIHLNILYIRSVKGFMNIVAMHELAHYFLWSINVPTSRLWIHEGIAQYMSLTMGSHLGYYDAVEIHSSTLKTSLSRLGNDLSFVNKWTPYSIPPQELDLYYAASYYIVNTLCDKYGGLNYLIKLFNVFKQFSSIDWYDNTKVIKAFGIAADDVNEVIELFREWGFEVEDSSFIIPSIPQIKDCISKMPSWLEPYKNLARMMVIVAELLQQYGSFYAMIMVARVSQMIHELSFFLMLISIALVAIAIIMLRRTA